MKLNLNLYQKTLAILGPIGFLQITATWFLVREWLWLFPWLIYSYDFVTLGWLTAVTVLMMKWYSLTRKSP